MKRYILSLIAIMIVFSACKKDAANKKLNDGKTTSVTFSVGYSHSTGGFNGATNVAKSKFSSHTLAVDTTLTKYASVIYVGVYTTSGSQLFLTKQLATDTVFGTVNYNLPAGNYIVTFAAGQTGMTETGTTLSNSYINYGNGGLSQWQNTFFQKMNLTVGSSPINQNVTLSRIGAQLVVNIEDAVPANVKSIIVDITDNPSASQAPQAFAVGAETPGIPGNPFTDPGYMVAYTTPGTAIVPGTKNLKLCIAFLKVDLPYTVTIAAYSIVLGGVPAGVAASNDPALSIAYVNIPNVTAQAGAQTILSGKLFGGNGLTNSGGFQMTIDPQWSTTTTTIPFQ